ncbi:hypothetical protein, partial [Bifidobacterium sp. SO1]|uniref:hypothetical protein n=1 Tax=Bifidobacterium sp. SO1 TaxID=2809029 RepID=UPI001BDD597A
LFCCEGTAERFILSTLIERDELIIPQSQIIRNRTDGDWAVKRSHSEVNEYLDVDYGDKPLLIIRIVDSNSDNYKPPKGYEHKVEVKCLHTHPEIEMLVIIAEGLYGQYTNKSKQLKPSLYCKNVLKYGQVKDWRWLERYWADPGKLEHAIAEYSRLHKFGRKEDRGILELIK